MRASFVVVPFLSALAVLVAACQPWSSEGTLRLVVDLDPALRSECVLVRVASEAEEMTSSPISRPIDRLTPLVVAIAQGGLPGHVMARATGYTAGCQQEEDPQEYSDAVVAQFKPFPPSEVRLRLSVRPQPADGGVDGGHPEDDSGVTDSGAEDAGVVCNGVTCAPGSRCNNHSECVPEFPYSPSNFTEQQLDGLTSTVIVEVTSALNINTKTADGGVEAREADGRLVDLPFTVLAQVAGGSLAAVLQARSFHVGDAGLLEVVGARPLIIAVREDATIDGKIIARAGADHDCARPGLNYSFDGDLYGGGGGGGFGLSGGSGAWSSTWYSVGQAASGTESLEPLRGGCRGGAGGGGVGRRGSPVDGGMGGGALQISAVGGVLVSGVVTAPGRGGRGAPSDNAEGGGGGGSGGALLLEGRRIILGHLGRLTANGGGGGQASTDRKGSTGTRGEDGLTDSDANASGGLNGSGASDCAGEGGHGGSARGAAGSGLAPACSTATVVAGGGGGGGAVGRIRLNTLDGCERQDGGIVSPPSTGSRTGC